MKRPLLTAVWLLSFFIVAAHISGREEAPKTANEVADNATDSQSAPFAASLLLIKADWSQSQAAKEIEADLRKALSGESVSAELLDMLPASGATILFPPETALLYTREHYAALLAWLKTKDLIVQTESFLYAEYQKHDPFLGDNDQGRTFHVATLEKDLAFFGLSFTSPSGTQPFVERRVALRWAIENYRRFTMARMLRASEKPRGEDRFLDRGVHDQCTFTRPALRKDEVLIAPAFPSRNDGTFRYAAARKGFEVLFVVENFPPTAAPAAAPRFVLPDKVERIAAEKAQNAAMGSLGFDQTASPGASRFVSGGNIMISWSEARDVAWGFSKSLGKWAKQELNPPAADQRGLVVDNDLAVWQVGSAYYGFSGQTGQWDMLRLPDDHKPPVVLDSGFARVHDSDDVYTFANSTGRWSSPKGSAGATESTPHELGLKVFTLRYAQAVNAERIVNQLFARDIQSVAADERTNSLIFRGPEPMNETIVKLLIQLDQSAELAGGRPDKSPTSLDSGTATTSRTGTASVATLAKTYEAKEQQAAELARQLRELQARRSSDKPRLDKLTADLRRLVGESFAARQELHRAEIAQLQQRIEGIRQNVKTRERVSEQIIQRRVKDLLNPDLQWEASETRPDVPGRTLAGAAEAEVPSGKSDLQGALLELPRPRVTYGTYWSPEAERVFEALGLQVQKLTKDDAPQPRLAGALKITAIDPNSPASELRVGDLIVGIQMKGTGGRANAILQATLEIRRGDENIPVTVDFPVDPTSSNLQRPGRNWPAGSPEEVPSGRRDLPDVAAREIRDKLRQRWEAIESLFTSGRVDLRDVIQAAKDLGEAELNSAANSQERIAAGEKLVERLKGVQSIVEARYRTNVEPIQHKLAVDAELLKAEGQLAAEQSSRRPPRSASSSRSETLAMGLTAARAYRDKVRERVQLLEQRHAAGTTTAVELLRAKTELDDAEFVAAANVGERQAARRQKVEHFKEIKAAIEKLHSAGAIAQGELLAVEAELLKAQAELAAEIPSGR